LHAWPPTREAFGQVEVGMKWVLLLVAGLVALAAVVAIIGALLPRNHTASRTLRLSRAPEDIWPVVTRLANASSVPVDVVESHPPHRLVTRVKETQKNFGGTWTIEITPVSVHSGAVRAFERLDHH